MYRLTASLLMVYLLALTSCTGSKSGSSKAYFKEHAAQNDPNDNNAYTPYSNLDKTQFTYYTHDLQKKLLALTIDYKKVQLYLDQKLILVKNIDSARAEVASGVIRIINSPVVDEITIDAYTPGIIDVIDKEGIWIKFENGNRLRFVPKMGPDAEDVFVIAGNNWDEGTCEVNYGNKIYRARCFKCPSIGSVHPLIKVAEVEGKKKNSKTLPGILIN